MFGPVQRTPFDIEFSLLGIPARIHPLFWIVTVIFGWQLGSPELVVLWVLCVFVSILIHEMGHALMAKAFGYQPHIVLHHFGGYASYYPDSRHTLWKSVAISFAGPLAGFVFYAVLLGMMLFSEMLNLELTDQVWIAAGMLLYINLYWGLVNLLPVLPLDGGRISEALLLMWRRREGELWALRISVAAGVGAALFFFQMEARYAAMMFGILALMNLQALGEQR